MKMHDDHKGDSIVPTVVRDTLLRLLHRDLAAMQREVNAYPDDASLWKLVPGIENSGGTLALHVAGNLQHFVGSALGATGYTRNRDAEFNSRDGSRDEVASILGEAMAAVTRTLRALDPSILDADYPIKVGADITLRTDVMLLHLAPHASYHLGQMDYHRRMITGDGSTMNTLPLGALLGPLPE